LACGIHIHARHSVKEVAADASHLAAPATRQRPWRRDRRPRRHCRHLGCGGPIIQAAEIVLQIAVITLAVLAGLAIVTAVTVLVIRSCRRSTRSGLMTVSPSGFCQPCPGGHWAVVG
jgi:hypothetical protein